MKHAGLVSVIIPVYNARPWLDRCLESVTGQTYRRLEILLCDDGSTDDSLAACREWAEKDARIRVFALPHGGAAFARNSALEKVRGEYLAFLDSDDWWEPDLVEKGVCRLREDDADLVWFDMIVHWRDGVRTSKKPVLPDGPVCVKTHPGILAYSGGSMCDKLFRAAFWAEHAFRFLDVPIYEDATVTPLVMLAAGRVSSLRCCAYHCDRRSENSLLYRHRLKRDDLHVYDKLFSKAADSGLLSGNEKILGYWLLFQLQLNRNEIAAADKAGKFDAGAEHDAPRAEARDLAAVLGRLSPQWRRVEDGRYLVFGSYNIRSVISYLLLDLGRVRHYQFSGIAGAFSERRAPVPPVAHASAYRAAMLNAERTGDLATRLRGPDLGEDFFCLDLLEERFPLLDCGPAGYFTQSDALLESGFDLPPRRVLRPGDEETEALWRECCLVFIQALQARFRPERVILAKFFLAESFGEYGPERPFAEAAEIRGINALLARRYDFFVERFPGIHVVPVPPELVFSDAGFKHGRAPWHLNDFCFYALCDEVRSLIEAQATGRAASTRFKGEPDDAFIN